MRERLWNHQRIQIVSLHILQLGGWIFFFNELRSDLMQ